MIIVYGGNEWKEKKNIPLQIAAGLRITVQRYNTTRALVVFLVSIFFFFFALFGTRNNAQTPEYQSNGYVVPSTG